MAIKLIINCSKIVIGDIKNNIPCLKDEWAQLIKSFKSNKKTHYFLSSELKNKETQLNCFLSWNLKRHITSQTFELERYRNSIKLYKLVKKIQKQCVTY